LVTSKKNTASRNFKDHLACTFVILLLLPRGNSCVLRAANEYPENIKAIGSTGKTNLLRKVQAFSCEAASDTELENTT